MTSSKISDLLGYRLSRRIVNVDLHFVCSFSDETPARPMDYRPVFFEGREPWIIDDDTLPSARTRDRRSPAPPPQSARVKSSRFDRIPYVFIRI